jgi:hypothetical protein
VFFFFVVLLFLLVHLIEIVGRSGGGSGKGRKSGKSVDGTILEQVLVGSLRHDRRERYSFLLFSRQVRREVVRNESIRRRWEELLLIRVLGTATEVVEEERRDGRVGQGWRPEFAGVGSELR